jgi:hypothetical protein
MFRTGMHRFFKTSRGLLQNSRPTPPPTPRKVKRSKFHALNRRILVATVHNLFATASFSAGIAHILSQRYFKLWMQVQTTVLISVSAEGNFSEVLTFTKFSARIVVDIFATYFAVVVCTYIYRFTDAVYVFMAHIYIFFWLQFTSYDLWGPFFYDSGGCCAICFCGYILSFSVLHVWWITTPEFTLFVSMAIWSIVPHGVVYCEDDDPTCMTQILKQMYLYVA